MFWNKKTEFPTTPTLNSILKEVVGSFEGKFPEVICEMVKLFHYAAYEVRISWKSGDERKIYTQQFGYEFFHKKDWTWEFIDKIHEGLKPELKVLEYKDDFKRLVDE